VPVSQADADVDSSQQFVERPTLDVTTDRRGTDEHRDLDRLPAALGDLEDRQDV
jgi:hypothetical protein